MTRIGVLALIAVGLLSSEPGAVAAPGRVASKPALYLDPHAFKPGLLLPPPPAPGSPAETRELKEVREIVAAASVAEREQTKVDDGIEDPSVFDAAIASGISLRRLPRTWALLTRVANEADAVASLAKHRFDRTRPWGVDPSIVPCDAGPGRTPAFSYPSGHAMLGYSVGLVLAEVLPDRAPAILARARDYAFERVVCGAHFPSDVEASHVLASIIVERLEAVPAFRSDVEAAKVELKAALHHHSGS